MVTNKPGFMMSLYVGFTGFSFIVPVILAEEIDSNLWLLGLGNALLGCAFLYTLSDFYANGSLLEPAPLFILVNYIFYGPGNWPAIAGMDRYIYNGGSMEYYPIASVAGGLGLWAYLICYKMSRTCPGHTEQWWRSGWAMRATFFIMIGAPILYLSLAALIGEQSHTFRGAGEELQGALNWSALTVHFFLFMAIVATALCWNSEWSWYIKGLLLVGAVTNFCILSSFVSRINLVTAVIVIFIALVDKWKTNLKSKKLFSIHNVLIGTCGLCVIAAVYMFGTHIKVVAIAGDSITGTERLGAIFSKDYDAEQVNESVLTDVGYRVAGLEEPAGIVSSQSTGRHPLWGQCLILGFLNSLPRFVGEPLGIGRPKMNTESLMIIEYGLTDDDQNGSILASCVADFGLIGVLIYFPLLAIFHAKVAFKLYANKHTVLVYLGLLPLLMRFDFYIEDAIFEYTKHMGFIFMVLCPTYLLIRRPFKHARGYKSSRVTEA